MQGHRKAKNLSSFPGRAAAIDVAELYNLAGEQYARYADGDPDRLFSFDGLHGYADRQSWEVLERKLNELRAEGKGAIRILDAGCGPGTWLRRCVTHAHRLGFTQIAARGFDLAEAQIETARRNAADLAALPGVDLNFEVADLTTLLPEGDASVDLTICLYSVLGHLPVALLPRVVMELARVTRGCLVATVRPVGSMPTAFVDAVEKVRYLKLDNTHDRCEIELTNGRRMSLSFHLFRIEELRHCFDRHFDIEDLRGLDIFHSRFSPDRRWNPTCLAPDRHIMASLAAMEEAHSRDPHFIEHAMHLLLVGRPRAGRATGFASGLTGIKASGPRKAA
jgi:SAM-dependent methyltransferase